MKTSEKMKKLAGIQANIESHRLTIHEINKRSIGLGDATLDKAYHQMEVLELKIVDLKKDYDKIVATM